MISLRLQFHALTTGLLTAALWASLLYDVRAQPALQDQPVAEWKKTLADGDLESRRQAAIATRTCETELQRALLPDFIELLRNETDGQIRLAILDTVTEMGPLAADAVPALVFAMRHDFGGRGNEERHQDYRAALALAHIGRPAVESLRNLLSDEKENIRAEAAMALGRIGPDAASAVPDLVALFEKESSRVRVDAVRAVGSIGAASLPTLLRSVKSENPAVRAAAVQAIGAVRLSTLTDARALEAVRVAVQDEVAAVRAAAVATLTTAGLPADELQTVFLTGLQDVDEEVQVAVVNALAADRSILTTMQSQLSGLLTVADEHVAWHAAFLLQQSGKEAEPMLLSALEDERSRVQQIARALALYGKPAVGRLEAALDDPQPRIRQGAALALGQIRPLPAETVARLAAGLNDTDRNVQAAFLTSIRSLGTLARAAVPAVRAKLGDDSPDIRMQVIDILFEAAPRDDQLIAELTSMVNDPDARVQQHAIQTLRSLGPVGRPAIPAVVEKLHSPDNDVRNAAAEFISSHGRFAQDAVSQLTDLLDQAESTWRIKLIETLGGLGATAQSASPKLTELAQDPSASIRLVAVQALGNLQLSPEQLQSQLVRALQDSDQEVQSQASRIIRRFGGRGMIFVPDLIPLAGDEQIGGSIGRMLERFERYTPDADSIQRLLGLLEHEQPQVRRAAVRFLGLAGPDAQIALPRLQPLSDDEDEEVRAEAMVAISKIRGDWP